MKNFKITNTNTNMEIMNISSISGIVNIPKSTHVFLTQDITINSYVNYLNLTGDNIIIDGKGYTITVTVADYNGFIKNGSSSTNAPCANCAIKNINIVASGNGNISVASGWICRSYFGRGISNGDIEINNCYSSGNINTNGGGIVGHNFGYKMTNSTITFNNCHSSVSGIMKTHTGGISGNLTGSEMSGSSIKFNNCYYIGNIPDHSGGIAAYLTGKKMINSEITFNNCYSTGTIGNFAGGIMGVRPGGGTIPSIKMSNSTITANNCYTIGSIGSNAGGIFPLYSHEDVTDSNCITSASASQTAGVWNDINAASTIGTSTGDNDVTNIWHDPGIGSWTHRTEGQTGIVVGCMDDNKFNYDSNANTDDGNCIDKVFGCIDDSKFNYDPNANTDDGNCIDKVFGCNISYFSNYDETANIDDGSCIIKLSGSLIDGYISGANGGLYDVNDLSTPIETFTTDSFGKYEISTQADQLPEVYTIKFEPGGIDISTGKEVTTELTSTSTKEKVLAGGETTLNVTPITSLVTLIVKKTEGPIDVTNLNESVDVVTTVFNIEESDLEKDFIEEGDANITGLVTQLETTTKSLAAAINNDSASESVILDSIVNFMIETNNDANSDTIDLADETNITGIVEQVETDNSEIEISETLKENATSLISQVNTKVEEIVQDNTKSFEDIITESVQLSVSTNDSLVGIDLDDINVDLTSVVSNIETNAKEVVIRTIFQSNAVDLCNDPDACNYDEEGECSYFYDCAGTCGGPAKKVINDCIVEYEI